jgi:cell division septation protein DedD
MTKLSGKARVELMRFLKFNSYYLILVGMILLDVNLSAQSQMTPKLKEFLTQNDIMDLIGKYGQDKIELTIKGVEQEKIEQRSYVIKPGFRCQVFAGTQLENANQVAAEVSTLQLDSVYVVKSQDNLVKVQVGNFMDRKDALVMVDKLGYAGVSGAWVVETDIHVPKKPRSQRVEKDIEEKNAFYFAVQVFNTRHFEKAQSYKASLERRFAVPVAIIPQNDLWKIVVGRFDNHESASTLLEKMRSEGFTDAWVTQVVN